METQTTKITTSLKLSLALTRPRILSSKIWSGDA